MSVQSLVYPVYVCVPVDGVVWVHLAYGASLRTYTGYVPTVMSYGCREYRSLFFVGTSSYFVSLFQITCFIGRFKYQVRI